MGGGQPIEQIHPPNYYNEQCLRFARSNNYSLHITEKKIYIFDSQFAKLAFLSLRESGFSWKKRGILHLCLRRSDTEFNLKFRHLAKEHSFRRKKQLKYVLTENGPSFDKIKLTSFPEDGRMGSSSWHKIDETKFEFEFSRTLMRFQNFYTELPQSFKRKFEKWVLENSNSNNLWGMLDLRRYGTTSVFKTLDEFEKFKEKKYDETCTLDRLSLIETEEGIILRRIFQGVTTELSYLDKGTFYHYSVFTRSKHGNKSRILAHIAEYACSFERMLEEFIKCQV